METASHRRAPRWALVGALLLAVAAAIPGAAPASPSAAAVGAPCKRAPLARCLTVAVPLDRSGRVPGKVSLHVEVLPAEGKQRGVVFLIAGGPGQAATQLFDFGEPLIGVLFRTAFPGYTLVAYDVRARQVGRAPLPAAEREGPRRPAPGRELRPCAWSPPRPLRHS